MNSGFCRATVAVVVGAMVSAAAVAAETRETSAVDFRRPAIVPVPRELKYDAQVAVRLTEDLSIKIACPETAVGNWVAAQFKAWFGVTPKIVTDARIAAEVPTIEGAYQLVAKPGAIEIAARGTQGVKYALYTLRQAAERESRGSKLVGYWLPALTINDAPELGFRGLHLCWMPELSAAFIEHQLRLAAYYKFNVVVLESWGVFKSERHPELSIANAPLTVAERDGSRNWRRNWASCWCRRSMFSAMRRWREAAAASISPSMSIRRCSRSSSRLAAGTGVSRIRRRGKCCWTSWMRCMRHLGGRSFSMSGATRPIRRLARPVGRCGLMRSWSASISVRCMIFCARVVRGC